MDDLRAYLALMHVPRMGGALLGGLLRDYSAQQLLTMPGRQLMALGLKPGQVRAVRAPDWAAIDAELRWLEQPGHSLVTLNDSDYPRLLREIPTPPAALFVRGRRSALSLPQVAVIGSRKPSSAGRENAMAFAGELCRCGYAVTSGLALGIDGAAHRGALDAGGETLAVLGSALDWIYPSEHRELAEQVAERGALISEFFPGTPPRASNFPRRNRVISGLSLGTLVVEASPRSGSLITARYALEQNREVFAIPGSIHNPLARGCHQLIAQGATLVTSAADIEQELLGWRQPAGQRQDPVPVRQAPSETTGELLAQVGFEPTSVDLLVARTGEPVERLLPQLLELELGGQIEAVAGGYVRK